MIYLKVHRCPVLGIFLAGAFYSLYCDSAGASPAGRQSGGEGKSNAVELKWNAYRGLDGNEISSDFWQLAGRAEIDGCSGQIYYDGELYSETLGQRSDYFVTEGDSLAWTGYSEGRSLGILLDSPLRLRPLRVDNSGVSGPEGDTPKRYTARGRLNVDALLGASGQAGFSVVRDGRAMAAAGDTLDRIVLTVQTDDYTVRSESTSESDTTDRTVYRWFVSGSEIPVAVQSEGILYLNASVTDEAQEEDNGGRDEAERVKSLIDRAVIDRNGTTVTVTLPEELSLHIYVMDLPGNIYASTEGVADSYTLDISGLQHNTYFISIVSAESEYTRRILLTL